MWLFRLLDSTFFSERTPWFGRWSACRLSKVWSRSWNVGEIFPTVWPSLWDLHSWSERYPVHSICWPFIFSLAWSDILVLIFRPSRPLLGLCPVWGSRWCACLYRLHFRQWSTLVPPSHQLLRTDLLWMMPSFFSGLRDFVSLLLFFCERNSAVVFRVGLFVEINWLIWLISCINSLRSVLCRPPY